MITYRCPKCGLEFSSTHGIFSPRCPACGQICESQNQTFSQDQQGNVPPHGQPQYAYGPGAEPGVFDVGPSGKSRGIAGLLGILLGYLGIHYFYMEKITAGIICIILSIATCGLWSIITLIQGIVILTMRQSDFEKKYIYTTSTFPFF